MHGGVGVIPLHPVESSSSPRSVLYPICTVSYRILLFASLVLSLNSRTRIHYTTHHYYFFYFFSPFFTYLYLFALFPLSPVTLPFLLCLSVLRCTAPVYTPNTKYLQLQLQPNCTAIRRRRRRNKKREKRDSQSWAFFLFLFFSLPKLFDLIFFPIISHYFICIFGVTPHSLIFCFYCLLLGFLLLLLIHPAPTTLTGCVGLAVCLRAAYYFG